MYFVFSCKEFGVETRGKNKVVKVVDGKAFRSFRIMHAPKKN
jgi:hypothetical protein